MQAVFSAKPEQGAVIADVDHTEGVVFPQAQADFTRYAFQVLNMQGGAAHRAVEHHGQKVGVDRVRRHIETGQKSEGVSEYVGVALV